MLLQRLLAGRKLGDCQLSFDVGNGRRGLAPFGPLGRTPPRYPASVQLRLHRRQRKASSGIPRVGCRVRADLDEMFKRLTVMPACMRVSSRIISSASDALHWGIRLTMLFTVSGDKMRGTRTLFSSIRDVARHQNHEFPYPIIVASSRASPTAPVTLNDPICEPPYQQKHEFGLTTRQDEFTPHSFGSFGPTLRASIPIDYMGTPMRGGRPMKDCVVGFENAA